MKYKVILFSLLSILILWACEDSVDDVGMGILPDQDKVGIYTDTIYLSASTVKLDSIYAKTIEGMLGEFHDPVYGDLKSSYICQFYAPSKNVFPPQDSIVGNKMDSVVLNLIYQYYLGDSLAPMEATVYPIVKSLEKHYYTNIDPTQYCDMNTVLGRQGYTARNLAVSDSANAANSYIKSLSIKLPYALAEKFYNEWLKPAPNAYSSLEAFDQFFPGVYIASTFGSGSLIYPYATYINVHFNRLKTVADSKGNDSTYITPGVARFNVTKEIIQLNSYQSSMDEQLLQPNEERTYIKTPAGIFTKITVPIPEIIKKMGSKKFTNAKLALSCFGNEYSGYKFGIPGKDSINYLNNNQLKMLLINKDSVKTFFENKQVADSKTTYSTTFYNYTYSFGNISSMIQNAIKEQPDKNLELLVIPIQTQYTTTSTSSGTVAVDYSSSHLLFPSAVSLRKDKEHLKLAVTATDGWKDKD